MPRGPLSCSERWWFAVLRLQIKVVPGSARSGTKLTAFPELSSTSSPGLIPGPPA